MLYIHAVRASVLSLKCIITTAPTMKRFNVPRIFRLTSHAGSAVSDVIVIGHPLHWLLLTSPRRSTNVPDRTVPRLLRRWLTTFHPTRELCCRQNKNKDAFSPP